MRISKPAACLLLLNLLWTGLFLYYLGRESAPAAGEPTGLPAPQPAPQPVIVEQKTVREVRTNQFHWAQLESEDYRTYIARLCSIGCPEQTIRDLIIADLDNLLAPELESLVPRRKELHYWEPEEEEVWNNVDHQEALRKKREIDFQKRAVLQELLGIDLVEERMRLQGQEDYYGRRLSFLPEEKRVQVRMILEKYAAEELAVREKTWEEGESLDSADREELRRIELARSQEIAMILTPEEQELFDLWLSPTANQVRYSVYGMNATEEEFRILYDLHKAFNETWNSANLDMEDEQTRQKWQAAQQELEAEIRRQLGDERYAAYQRGRDPEYHALNAAVTRFKLPENLANEVYEIKRLIQEETAAIQNDPDMDGAEREQALAHIRQETETVLKEVLGEKPLRYLRNRGFANWAAEF